jgi:hypothetical protein
MVAVILDQQRVISSEWKLSRTEGDLHRLSGLTEGVTPASSTGPWPARPSVNHPQTQDQSALRSANFTRNTLVLSVFGEDLPALVDEKITSQPRLSEQSERQRGWLRALRSGDAQGLKESIA